YAVFLLTPLVAVFAGVRPLMMPALFFITYGVGGNAVAHLMWTVVGGQYFPGLYTSLAYWILAPVLLRRAGLSWREALVMCLAVAIVILLAAGTTMNMAVLR